MTDPRVVEVYFDGGSRGNPGPSAAAAIVRDTEGTTLRHRGIAIDHATNNVAEWTGLLLGLQLARDLEALEVRMFGDSKLVVEQFSGRYAIHAENLRSIALEASKIARGFRKVTVEHVPRDQNRPADMICNAVLDGSYIRDTDLPASPGDAPASPADVTVTFLIEISLPPDDVARKSELGMSVAAMRAQLARAVEGRLRLAGAIQLGADRARTRVTRVKG